MALKKQKLQTKPPKSAVKRKIAPRAVRKKIVHAARRRTLVQNIAQKQTALLAINLAKVTSKKK